MPDSRDIVIIVLLIALALLALRMLYLRLRPASKRSRPVRPVEPQATELHVSVHLPQAIPRRMPSTLTPREQDVAQLIVQGKSNKEIAAELELSIHTVQNHLKRIFAKLEVRSRTELAVRLQQISQAGN